MICGAIKVGDLIPSFLILRLTLVPVADFLSLSVFLLWGILLPSVLLLIITCVTRRSLERWLIRCWKLRLEESLSVVACGRNELNR